MTERRTNLVFMAIFSVLAVLSVVTVLLVMAWVLASGSGISPSSLPPSFAKEHGD